MKANKQSNDNSLIKEIELEQMVKKPKKQTWNKIKNLKLIRFFTNNVWPILLPFFIVMIFLIILPLLSIIIYSIIKPTGNSLLFSISFNNFAKLFADQNIMQALGLSIFYAFVASFLAVIIGYPMAYIMWKLKSKIFAKNLWILITLPIWINMLMKVLGLQTFFYLVSPSFLGTSFALVTGMVYMFLPFAVTPIYNALEAVDKELIYASRDLGAGSVRTFWLVIFRLTIPGVLAGFSLVMVQASTSLLVVHYIGNGKITLISTIIESYFFKGSNFGYGAAISVVLAILVFLIIVLTKFISLKFEKKGVK